MTLISFFSSILLLKFSCYLSLSPWLNGLCPSDPQCASSPHTLSPFSLPSSLLFLLKYSWCTVLCWFQCTTQWFDICIPNGTITVSLVTICPHVKLLHYYWSYSSCCILYPCDLFILQLDVYTFSSSSPVWFSLAYFCFLVVIEKRPEN